NLVFDRRIRMDVAFGESHGADVQRDELLRSLRSSHELGRSSADVADQIWRRFRHVDRGAHEAQLCFLISGEQDRIETGRALHSLHEVLAVRGVAYRAGRDDADDLGVKRARLLDVSGDGGGGSTERLRPERPIAIDAFAQPSDNEISLDIIE